MACTQELISNNDSILVGRCGFDLFTNMGTLDIANVTKMPKELTNVPENVKHLDKLVQIIGWSMKRQVCDPPVRRIEAMRTSNEKLESEVISNTTPSGQRSESGTANTTSSSQGSDSGTSSSTKTQISTGTESEHSVSESSSLPSGKLSLCSTSPVGRVSKLHALKEGVLSSTTDLLATIRVVRGRDSKARTTKASQNSAENDENVGDISQCTACFADLPKSELNNLPCTHEYCKECLVTLIMTTLKDESLFPPKCCLSAIPLQMILFPLDPNQRQQYKLKSAEYSVPAKNRWYCPNTKCLKWIPPGRLKALRTTNMKCPHCGIKICCTCRGIAHEKKRDCPQDFGLEATLEIANSEGWQRCYKCRAMVELTVGCRHIKCKCGAEFCYTCGAKWGKCNCTELDQIDRRAIFRLQRTQRNTRAHDNEAREIALAIAQVEDMERWETEAREREQQRRDVERLVQAAGRARLEQLRLEEEACQVKDEEKAQSELREAAVLSLIESLTALKSGLRKVTVFQRSALENRHKLEIQKLEDNLKAKHQQLENDAESLIRKIGLNIEKRRQVLLEKQKLNQNLLSQRQEGQDDDCFLQIQLYLQGKPNREARETRMREELKRHQQKERKELLDKHTSEMQALMQVAEMEVKGVGRSNTARMLKAITEHKHKIAELYKDNTEDQSWLNIITQRRSRMVLKDHQLLLEDLEAGKELTGLTEEIAIRIDQDVSAKGIPEIDSINWCKEDLIPRKSGTSTDRSGKIPLSRSEASGSSSTVSTVDPKSPQVSQSDQSRQSMSSSRTWGQQVFGKESVNSAWTWTKASPQASQEDEKRCSTSTDGTIEPRVLGEELINSAWNWMTGSSYPASRKSSFTGWSMQTECSSEGLMRVCMSEKFFV